MLNGLYKLHANRILGEAQYLSIIPLNLGLGLEALGMGIVCWFWSEAFFLSTLSDVIVNVTFRSFLYCTERLSLFHRITFAHIITLCKTLSILEKKGRKAPLWCISIELFPSFFPNYYYPSIPTSHKYSTATLILFLFSHHFCSLKFPPRSSKKKN